MNRILKFSFIELKIILKEKSFYFWALILPIAFVFIFSGLNSQPEKKDIKNILYITNNDKEEYSRELIEYFKREKLIIKESNKKGLRRIIIPEDFSVKLKNEKKVNLTFRINSENSNSYTIHAKISIYRAIYKFLINKYFDIKKIKEILTIKTEWAGKSSYIPGGVIHQLPATLITFLLFNLLIFGGTNLVKLRQRGMLERYVVTPMGKRGIWLGMFVTNMIVAFLVINAVTFISILLFSINFGFLSLIYLYIILIVFSGFVSSLSIFIASLLKRFESVIGVSVLLANVLAALGGCWWPIEIVPDFMKKIAMILPTGWTMEALDKIMFYKYSFYTIINDLIFLIIIGIIFALLSIKYFKTDKV